MSDSQIRKDYAPIKILFQEGLHDTYFLTFDVPLSEKEFNFCKEEFLSDVATANGITKDNIEVSEYKDQNAKDQSENTVMNLFSLSQNLFENFMINKGDDVGLSKRPSTNQIDSPGTKPLRHHSIIVENIINPQHIEMDMNGFEKKHFLFHTGQLFRECVEQEKQENPFIYSSHITSTFLSYIPNTGTPLPKCPVPIYLSTEQSNSIKGVSKADCLLGLQITKSGELKCVDKQVIESQKGLISELIKLLAKSIAEGRGVVGVSLPVRIFEPRSLIERIIDWWSYGPTYLKRAAKKGTVVDRIKLIICYMVSGMHAGISLYKPFNPLLGETYQGTFEDGSSITCEHICHHPPISYFSLYGEGYKMYGHY